MALTRNQFRNMLINQMSQGRGFAGLTSGQKEALTMETNKAYPTQQPTTQPTRQPVTQPTPRAYTPPQKTQAELESERRERERQQNITRYTGAYQGLQRGGAGTTEIADFQRTIPQDIQQDVLSRLGIKKQPVDIYAFNRAVVNKDIKALQAMGIDTARLEQTTRQQKIADIRKKFETIKAGALDVQKAFQAGLPTTITTPPERTETPSLPAPDAGSVQDTFTVSAQGNLDTSRATLESAYSQQIEELNKQVEDSKKSIEELTTLEAEGVADVGTLMQPFRQKLEEAERERLSINKNFQENQKLVNELGTLLTEGNDLIRQQKELTGLGAIRNPRISKTISDVNSRVGVIQAVMNARNGQINQAYNMIDRTIDAVNADKKDQLTYYSTLMNFYEGQKDDEGRKLVTLEKTKRDFLNAQIGLLQNDLAQSQENADYIKELMTDPNTALLVAKSGIKANDTPQEINAKMARQIEFDNKLKAKEEVKKLPADIATFKQFYPETDITTPQGRQQYLNWQAREAAAGRKPEAVKEPKNIFSTPDGEDIDITSVEGIKRLKDLGYNSFSELNAFLDVNTGLDKTSRENLLKSAGFEQETKISKEMLENISDQISDRVKGFFTSRKTEFKKALLLIEKNRAKQKWSQAQVDAITKKVRENLGQ